MFGTAPPKIAPALDPLVEWLLGWSWSCFEKYLTKRFLCSSFASTKVEAVHEAGEATILRLHHMLVEAENGFMASFTTEAGPKKYVWEGFS